MRITRTKILALILLFSLTAGLFSPITASAYPESYTPPEEAVCDIEEDVEEVNEVFVATAEAINFSASAKSSVLTLHEGGIGPDDALDVGPDGLLYNQRGEEVVLVGTNFGGWMIQESWMCPVIGNDRARANLNTIRAMEDRGWSAEQIQVLFDTYQDNYITEDDFDYIKSLGMNTVRIPFWYRNFMSDEEGTYINDDNGRAALTTNPGFVRLDWAVEQAQKRGMYVILDLHGAVGGQSMNHSTGTLERNTVFTNPVHRAATIDLWVSLALRYKDNPAVAVYDIMNEPQNNGDTPENQFPLSQYNNPRPGSAMAIQQTNQLYTEIYHAVRAVDPQTIYCVEAIWTMDSLPDDELTRQWTDNVMYSMHLYDNNKGNPNVNSGTIDYRTQEMLNVRAERGVAVYVGEFNNDNSAAGSNNQFYAYHLWNENHVSWTSWTYKVSGWNRGQWGLVHNPSQALNANPTDATFTIRDGSNTFNVPSHSYEEMLVKWGPVVRTFIEGTQVFNDGFRLNTTSFSFIDFGLKSAAPKAKPAVMFNDFEESDGVTALNATTVALVDSEFPGTLNEKAIRMTITGNAQDPNNSRRAVRVTPTEGGSFDASGYGWIVFNILDTQGNNRVWIGFNGSNGGWHNIGNAAQTNANFNGSHGGRPALTVRNEWTRIAVPLSAAGARFNNIQNILIGFNNAGTYFIDSIYFADDPNADPPTAGMPTLEGRPEISPAGGVLPVGIQNVVINYADPAADIRYTLDGSVPNAESLLYVDGVNIGIIPGRETIVRARAFIGEEFSRVAVAAYSGAASAPTYDAYFTGNNQNSPGAGWVRYEAENPAIATIIGSGRSGDNPPGTEAQSFYSGGRAAGGLDLKTPLAQLLPDWSNLSHVRFTVEVEQTGEYLIRLRYNGNDDGKHIIAAANGGDYSIISLPRQGNGGWNVAYTRQFHLALQAGTNEVWVSAPFDVNWANIDCIDIRTEPLNSIVGIQYTEIEDIPDQYVDPAGVWPIPVVKFGETTLVYGEDFLVEYANNNQIGVATATIYGINGYTGSATISFNILKLPELESADNAKFVSMQETAKGSRVWILTFDVTITFVDGTNAVLRYDVIINSNNANPDGIYVFPADHDLAGFTLTYDIKGNGSNIKTFNIR